MTTNYLNTIDAAQRAQVLEVVNSKLPKTQKMMLLVVECKVPANDALNLAGVCYRPAGYTLDNVTFGVELECIHVNKQLLCDKLRAKGITCTIEGYNHTDSEDHFKIVSDSSLRGEDTAEVVSPILHGRKGLKTLKTVCETLQEIGADVNVSCGTHVHLGAKDFKTKRVKNLLINYKRLEGLIDSMMPRSRRGNCNWCGSLTPFSDESIQNARNMGDLMRMIGTRYSKVNLEALARHNTIEFRQHSGTIDYQKIEVWISFLQNLVSYSKRNTVEEGVNDINAVPFIGTKEKEFYFKRIQKFNA